MTKADALSVRNETAGVDARFIVAPELVARDAGGQVRLVGGAKIGLSHATGGGVTGLDHGACTIHIFTR